MTFLWFRDESPSISVHRWKHFTNEGNVIHKPLISFLNYQLSVMLESNALKDPLHPQLRGRNPKWRLQCIRFDSAQRSAAEIEEAPVNVTDRGGRWRNQVVGGAADGRNEGRRFDSRPSTLTSGQTVGALVA